MTGRMKDSASFFHANEINQTRNVTRKSSNESQMVCKQLISDTLFDLLGTPEIPRENNEDFAAIGIDSTLSVEFSSVLSSKFGGAALPPDIALQCPTVDSLITYLKSSNTMAKELDLKTESMLPDLMPRERTVVISGCNCRFPGRVQSSNQLNDFLFCARNPMSYFSSHRQFIGNQEQCKVIGGFLDNIDSFDCKCFRISPREAKCMDPKQRILLETCVRATQNGFVTLGKIRSNETAVLVGAWSNDYASLVRNSDTTVVDVAGCSEAMSAGRIAYFFNARGPSMCVDTACSSGAVAVHLARQMLISGHCGLAMCGAANLCFDSKIFDAFRQNGLLSESGQCRTFDVDADGYVRSEAVIILILETCAKHTAMAELSGCACNQDGTSSGQFSPNFNAQVQVAREACRHFYGEHFYGVEAHGTGTLLGDQIEMNSIMTAHSARSDLLVLGSVKSCLGHTEASSGLAGMLKCISMMKDGLIPHLHLRCLKSDAHRHSILLPYVGMSFTTKGVCLNSYGLSGTNVSMVLSAPKTIAQQISFPNSVPFFIPISAKSKLSLGILSHSLIGVLKQSSTELPSLAISAQQILEPYPYRILTYGFTTEQAVSKIESMDETVDCEAKKMAWMFSGSQYSLNCCTAANFLSNCYDASGHFMEFESALQNVTVRYNLHHCHEWQFMKEKVEKLSPLSLMEEQTLLFCLQFILFRIWSEFIEMPDAVLGHSFGELTAATMAGIMSLEEACMLIVARAQLIMSMGISGQMVSTKCSKRQLSALQLHGICIACYNCPDQVVMSGIDLCPFSKLLNWCGLEHNFISSVPYHSPAMTPVAKELASYTREIKYQVPSIPLISTMSGKWLSQINHNYWREQICQPVVFSLVVDMLVNEEFNYYMEIGSDSILLNLVRRCMQCRPSATPIRLLTSFQSDIRISFAESLEKHFLGGIAVNWVKFSSNDLSGLCCLQQYPFAKDHYWIDVPEKMETQPGDTPWMFKTKIDINLTDSHLRDHVVRGEILYPTASFLELIIDAVYKVSSLSMHIRIKNFTIFDSLSLSNAVKLITRCLKVGEKIFEVAIASSGDYEKTLAKAKVILGSDFLIESPIKVQSSKISFELTASELYGSLLDAGYAYGISFQVLSAFKSTDENCYAHIDGTNNKFSTTFDSFLQAILLSQLKNGGIKMLLPMYVGQIDMHLPLSDASACAVSNIRLSSGYMIANCIALDSSHLPVCCITDAQFSQPGHKPKAPDGVFPQNFSYKSVWRESENVEQVPKYCQISNLKILGWNSNCMGNFCRLLEHLGIGYAYGQNSDFLDGAKACWSASSTSSYITNLFDLIILTAKCMIINRAEHKYLWCLHPPQHSLNFQVHNQNFFLPFLKCFMAEDKHVTVCNGTATSLNDIQIILQCFSLISSSTEKVFYTIMCKKQKVYEESLLHSGSLHEKFVKSQSTENKRKIITGGSMGIGFEMAKDQCSQNNSQIILISRRSATPSHQDKINIMRSHFSVHTCTSDAADGEHLTNITRVLYMCSLSVCHSAGALYDASITNLTLQQVKLVHRSKSVAAAVLYALTKLHNCSSLMLFSSISGIIGMAGQANYASANMFLDCLAEFGQQEGRKVISIAWANWISVGMAKDLENKFQNEGICGMSTDVGMECMLHASTIHMASVLYVEADWSQILRCHKYLQKILQFLTERQEHASDVACQAEKLPVKTNIQVQGTIEHLEWTVETALKTVLHIKSDQPINKSCGFIEMGMDSISAIEFHDRMEDLLGDTHNIPFTIVFDYPTVSSMAKYLEENIVDTRAEIFNEADIVSDVKKEDMTSPKPIVFGAACCMPKTANCLNELWKSLISGEDCMSLIPSDRYNFKQYYNKDVSMENKMYVNGGAFLCNDLMFFDNPFFNISPREADAMDPQQQLLLQTVWHSIENAGLKEGDYYDTNTGVFIGSMNCEFHNLMQCKKINTHSASGSYSSIISGRVAYFYGTQGQAVTVDTACSSSLVAMQIAHQNLVCGAIIQAYVGGVDLMLSPEGMIMRCKSRMLSPDCHCKTMDNNADGYARGEGCCTLILKSGAHSFESSLAIINGMKTNQDGRSSGLTVPNGVMQHKLIDFLIKSANALHLDYAELHGTGTAIGDPIEVNAIISAIPMTEKQTFLGSIKVNMGHCESTAGVVGVVKLILSIIKNISLVIGTGRN